MFGKFIKDNREAPQENRGRCRDEVFPAVSSTWFEHLVYAASLLFTSVKLVMFDIDGTLTQTFAVDTECYVEAVREVAGFQSISTNWARYQHTSDSGILDELYRTHLGRSPSEDESNAGAGAICRTAQSGSFQIFECVCTRSRCTILRKYSARSGFCSFPCNRRMGGIGSIEVGKSPTGFSKIFRLLLPMTHSLDATS